jgi:hypothetical protein
MKNIIRCAAASLAFSLAALSVHATDAGYVDLGRFKAVEGCEFVEVDLGSPLLKFASRLVAREDQEAAALLRGLKHVRVNVVGYDDATCADTTDRLQKFRAELVRPWPGQRALDIGPLPRSGLAAGVLALPGRRPGVIQERGSRRPESGL